MDIAVPIVDLLLPTIWRNLSLKIIHLIASFSKYLFLISFHICYMALLSEFVCWFSAYLDFADFLVLLFGFKEFGGHYRNSNSSSVWLAVVGCMLSYLSGRQKQYRKRKRLDVIATSSVNNRSSGFVLVVDLLAIWLLFSVLTRLSKQCKTLIIRRSCSYSKEKFHSSEVLITISGNCNIFTYYILLTRFH